MADVKKIVPGNVEGEFFVDKTCINCDTCRQLAPHCFVDGGEYSRVYKQPQGKQARIEATEALLACPTGSIGSRLPKTLVKEATQNFPKIIEDNVYYCGFNSAKSYGGNSFLIVDPAGNWLIDSPRFNRHLVERFGSLGGLKYIFLTHE
ncbi:MAG: ferredoxin, partial [Candidatus Obscuribacterales bacterium]|nr:ferredoxin [Candidatus Obscuribacterales bacterium]